MRNRIAGIMHWEHVGIEHANAKRAPAKKGMGAIASRAKNPYATIAAVTLLGVAIVLSLRALFSGPSARA